ncbi:hypothetical protein RBH29_12205 [Herbivorax sp. ANBcel31]|uniref:hypothetical protein n=1 Tax=Herbivorax sp. ANBcel31 TaxID=3069754 RepID=UPI0027B6D92A|nr:hypothetical protein [Herbivorax sp. ANBcel31]MDQ2087190.1 hypothetical protein [Herbivorax sp. ANBcel31]
MNVKDIFNALKPLKKRIFLNNVIDYFCYFFIGAGILSLMFSIVSLFVPVAFIEQKIFIIYISLILLAFVFSYILMPKPFKIAKIADSLGLKERVVTSYELKDDESDLAKIQRNDALKVVKRTDFKSLYKINVPYSKFLTGILLLSLTLTVFMIPTEARERAQLKEDMENETKEQIEKIKEERENLNKDEKVSLEKLAKVNEVVDSLLEELKDIKDEEEAIKALSKARNELDELKNDDLEDLQRISDKLKESQLSKDLGEALEKGDMEGVREELEGLEENLKNISDESLNEFLEKLQEAIKELSENEKLSEKLEELIEEAKLKDEEDIQEMLDKLEDLLEELIDINDLMELENMEISGLENILNSGISNISQMSGNSFDFSGIDEIDTEDINVGNQNGQGSESGEENNYNGQGDGEGSGASGEGGSEGEGGDGESEDGSSTANRDFGHSEASGGGGALIGSDSQIREFEEIYVPERLGLDADVSQVTGTVGESGESQVIETDGPILEGEVLPYNEVIGEYREEGMSSLKDAPIPQGMKDIVRDYFSTLDDKD